MTQNCLPTSRLFFPEENTELKCSQICELLINLLRFSAGKQDTLHALWTATLLKKKKKKSEAHLLNILDFGSIISIAINFSVSLSTWSRDVFTGSSAFLWHILKWICRSTLPSETMLFYTAFLLHLSVFQQPSKYSPPPQKKSRNTKSLLIRAFSSVWGCSSKSRFMGSAAQPQSLLLQLAGPNIRFLLAAAAWHR